jgi:Bifunctional DNA primase/polymerase, N-terminal
MDWTNTWRNAFRTELRAEAIGLAYHGWPVVPGTYPDGLEWVGRTAAPQHGPVPLHDNWMELASAGPGKVAALWSGRPFSLLLATGLLFDVIDMAADIGRRTAAELRNIGLPAPIAATPAGRWLFPVVAGEPLCTELAEHPDVVLRGHGSWVALPPSPFVHGVVHWRVKPDVSGWQVPRSLEIQRAVVDALSVQQPTGAGTAVFAAESASTTAVIKGSGWWPAGSRAG